jgi:phage recombination protein Bet
MSTPSAALQTVGPQRTNAISQAADELVDQIKTVQRVLAPDLDEHELRLFALVAMQKKLDPFSGQIRAVKRQTKQGPRVTFQTGIDGYRSLAEQTKQYSGSDEPKYGDIVEKPFPHPEWASVSVYREMNGARRAQSATVWWDEFYPGESEGFKWRQSPRHMLAKCAEALALRKAFPGTFAELYIDEEMQQADAVDAAVNVTPAPTAKDRIAARRAEVESAGSTVQGEEEPLTSSSPEPQQLVLDKNEQLDEFAALLGQRAAAFKADDPAESAQKAKLREILSQVGNEATDKVLKAAFGLDKRNEITTGQAAAILDLNAKDASFVERWKQAAE